MRTPSVVYELDTVVRSFIERVTGGSSQDLLIGCEICVAAGVATRSLSVKNRDVVMEVRGTDELKSHLQTLNETSDVVSNPGRMRG
jgi:hypothetical protein